MADRRQRFEELTREYAALMAAAVRRVCVRRHRALIPDVEQEIRLALWKRLGSGKEIRHPTSYLYKVALTTALRVVRRHGSEDLPFDEQLDSMPNPAPSPDAELTRTERSILIAEALETLDVEHARAVKAYLAGYNHVEVADLFGWTESVARHRIYRGIDRLKQNLGGQDSGESGEHARL